MLTRSAYVSPVRLESLWVQRQGAISGRGRWARCRAEVLGHVTILEQATRAGFEGYLSGLLFHQAGQSAQRLLALAETMAWREGACVAQEMAHLFHTTDAFGLVQALHLSELLAAFYRAMARASAGQPRVYGADATRGGNTAVPPVAAGGRRCRCDRGAGLC